MNDKMWSLLLNLLIFLVQFAQKHYTIVTYFSYKGDKQLLKNIRHALYEKHIVSHNNIHYFVFLQVQHS